MDNKNNDPNKKPIPSLADIAKEAYQNKDNVKSTYDPGTTGDISLEKAGTLLGDNNRPGFGSGIFNQNLDNAIKTKAYQEAKKKAEDQGFLGEAAAFLNQTVIGELVGGTIDAVGFLFDWDQVDTLRKGETSYGSWLSEIGNDIRDWSKEKTPIYVDPDVQAKIIDMGSHEWWFSNLPSVVSAFTILIPVAGEAKAISLIGQGIKATKGLAQLGKMGKSAKTVANILDKTIDAFRLTEKGLSNGAKLTIEGLHRAAVSTHIEAGMESVGAYKEEYQKLLNSGMSDLEAKKLAGETGAFVYRANWANFATEFMQQMLLLKTGPALTKGVIGGVEAEAAGLSKKVGRINLAKDYAKQFLFEGGEEAYQHIITQEGKYIADIKAGLTEEESFGDKMLKYSKDGELWTSAFFGGVGGAVFHKFGNKLIGGVNRLVTGAEKGLTEQQIRIEDLKSQHTRALQASKALGEAKESGSPEAILHAENDMALVLGTTSAKNQTLDYMLDRFKNLKNLSKEEREANGIDDHFVKNIDRYSKNIIKAAEMYTENTNRYGSDISESITYREYHLEKLNEDLPRIRKEYGEAVTKLPRYSETTIEGRKLIDETMKLASLHQNKLVIEHYLKTGEMTSEERKTQEKNVEILNKAIELNNESLKQKEEIYKNLNEADQLVMANLDSKFGQNVLKAKIINDSYDLRIKNLSDELTFLTSKAGQEQLRKQKEETIKKTQNKKQDQTTTEEAELANEAAATEDTTIEMDGPTFEKYIAEGRITEEQIMSNPKAKQIWEDYKSGKPTSNTTTTEDNSEENEGGSFIDIDLDNNVTKEDKTKGKETITFASNIEEVETPVNSEEEIIEGPSANMENSVFTDSNQTILLSTASALAWKSFNNTQAEKKDFTEQNKAFANFVENPLINLKGLEIRFSIDYNNEAFTKNYKGNVSIGEMANAIRNNKIPENIGLVPIKATFYKDGKIVRYNNHIMETYIHRSDYTKFSDPLLREEIIKQKTIIVENLLKGNVVSTTLNEKNNGHLRTSKNKETNKFDKRPITEIFPDIKDVVFTIGSNGRRIDPSTKQVDDSIGNKTTDGAVYLTVRTANNNTFGLRANVENLSVPEANLIHAIYVDILKNPGTYKQSISQKLIDFINNNQDTRIKDMNTYLDLSNITNQELLDHLVFNGKTKTQHAKDNKLFHTISNDLVIGDVTILGGVIDTEESRTKVVKFLTENRRRQISVKYLSNENFKKYVVTNGILTTNAVPTDNKRLFVQPLLTYNNNFNISKPTVVTKKEENVTKTTTTSNDLEAKKTDIEKRRQEELTEPKVILPIGTSGSGKSTFIKSLPQENLVVIEPDAMRVEFTGDINNKSKDKEIYIEAANRAIQAIKQGKQVVFDTTNLTKDKRLPFIEAIKKAIPTANIQYKLMELNPELAKQRIKAQLEEYNKAVEEANARPSTTNIPQNLQSGVEQYGTLQYANKEAQKVLGKNVTSIELIEKGIRTRTTRTDKELEKYNIKVGSYIKMFGKDQFGNTKNVIVKITKIVKGYDDATWYKEGWTEEGLEKLKKHTNSANAVEFKVITKRAAVSDETIDRHAASYKQMLEDIKNEPITEFKSNEEINDEYDHVVSYTKYLNSNQKNKLLSEASKKKDLALKELENQKTVKPIVTITPVVDTRSNVQKIADLNKEKEKELNDRRARSFKKDFNELNELSEDDIIKKYNDLIDQVFNTPEKIETKVEKQPEALSEPKITGPVIMDAFKQERESIENPIVTETEDYEEEGGSFIDFTFNETLPSEKPITPEEASKATEDPKEESDLEELIKQGEKLNEEEGGSIFESFKTTDVKSYQEHTPNYDTFNREVTHIRSLLPKAIAIKLSDDYVKVLKNGRLAIGLFKDNMIYLSKKSFEGTAYHEAFHAVYRTMLSYDEQKSLYKEASKAYVKYTEEDIKNLMVEHQVQRQDAIEIFYEEQMADDFMDFMKEPNKFSYSKGIQGLFQRLLDWLNNVFLNNITRRKLFNDISTGKYKNKPVRLSRGVAYKTIEGGLYKMKKTGEGFDPQDVPDIVRQLSFIILTSKYPEVKATNKKEAREIGKKLEIKAIKDELLKTMARNHKLGNTELSHRAKKVYDNLTDFYYLTTNYIESLGLSQDIESQGEDSDGNVIYKPSYEISGKDGATQKVKLMIALIPKFKTYDINDFKNRKPDLNTYLGLPKFENFNSVWNRLEKHLTGTVPINRNGIEISTFDLIMEKLTTMGKYHTSLAYLKNKLSTADTFTKSEFAVAFSRYNGIYVDTLISGTSGNFTYKHANADVLNAASNFAKVWSNKFVENFGIMSSDGKLVHNPESLQKLTAIHNEFNMSLLNDKRNKKVSANTINLFKEELNLLGINLSEQALTKVINDEKDKIKKTDNENENTLKAYDNLFIHLNKALVSSANYNSLIATKNSKAKSGELTEENNHILDQKFFKEILAEAEAEFVEIQGENTIPGPDGTTKWISQDHSLMSIILNQVKLGDLSLLEKLSKLPFNRSSKWINDLLTKSETRDKVRLVNYNNYKIEKKNDAGNKAKDLKEPDQLNDNINKYLKGIYVGLAEADKSQQFYIEGFDTENSQVLFKDGQVDTSGNNAVNILYKYFRDEVARMVVAHNQLYNKETNQRLKDEDKIIYYHYAKTPGDNDGNWKTSYLFPNMDLEVMGIINRSKVDGKTILAVNAIETLKPEQVIEIQKYIKEQFIKAVQNDVKVLNEYKIINYNNGQFNNITLDSEILSTKYQGNVIHAVGDYTLNSIIANVEFTKLFTQDPALFKNKGDIFEDFKKRIPLITASGKLQRIFDEGEYKVKESYNSAVIQNIETPSAYFTDPKNIKAISLATEISEDEIKDIFLGNEWRENKLGAYGKVNQTDAQAWITIDLYRERMLGFGKWNADLEEVFKRIKAGDDTFEDNLLFAQPLKTVHSEIVILNGVATIQYNKQSEAVLLPNIVKGTKMQNILDAMINQKIDHIITLDGKKTGARGVAQIINKETNELLPTDQIKLHPTILSNKFLFLQQDLPHKGLKDTLIGSQMVKNVLSMLVLTDDYEGMSGIELYGKYNQTIGKLSDLGLIEFQDKIGYNETEDRITDKPKFNKEMAKAIKDVASDNITNGLINNLNINTLFQFKNKFQNKLGAMITRASVKQKQPGGSMIYTSNFGMENTTVKLTDKIVENGIIWFKKPSEELNPARLVENTALNSEENSIFVELQKDLTEGELTKEQQDLLKGKNIKELEPTTDNLGLLIKVHCK